MPKIKLQTFINATPQRVFDLSRSVDLHMISAEHTNETVVNGKAKGLMELGEEVTWRARHFGIYWKMKVKITDLNSPYYFVDEMISGVFNSLRHEHFFEAHKDGTLMTDVFVYQSPFKFLGYFADILFLKKYMTRFLIKRNEVIQEYAEFEKWKS